MSRKNPTIKASWLWNLESKNNDMGSSDINKIIADYEQSNENYF